MFTGIIESVGTIRRIKKEQNLITLSVQAASISKDVKKGDSISIEGTCLSAVQKKGSLLSFEVMKETLEKTTLGKLKVGSKVNLERALKANGRIDGHFVTGHVDGMGVITKVVRDKNYSEFHVKASRPILRYIVAKGSICVDGISLTIGRVGKHSFSFYLIPYTDKMTTLGKKRAGQAVNIETDILAKYLLK